MRIAIVDDDENWRERVREEIVRYDENSEIEIETFVSGENYLERKSHYDISFVDIEMSGIDGFETIRQSQETDSDGVYIILTTHAEMSRKGYLVNAFRYIDKLHLEELQEAIDSAKKVLGRNKKIEVNVIGGGVRKITLKNIIYVETEKHYILIHTKQGTIKCSNTMKEIENMLPGEWFNRCHNVYIVNLDEIKRIDERIVYLSNGDDIDISHRRMNQFKKIYISRQFECANA